MRRCLIILLLLASTAASASAADTESHERILQSARTHILQLLSSDVQSLKVTPGALDSRLRLPRCPQPLETFSTGTRQTGTRQTVGVRCRGATEWTIYVSLKVELSRAILVSNRALTRGSRIAPGDLRLETRVVSGLHSGYLDNPAEAVGRTLKRALRKDAVLTPGQLHPRLDIRRGGQVTIVGRSGSIEVRMAGKAHQDASRGDRVKVTNISSQREIEGIVVARDTVEVAM
ncbi:MAG: flagellar basal body P-ring formation protein FlgA [Gammaproteobacteria bacterium]|nr:flagellar basal body P-ring formation protein FlgA [Gammaproteobacteria bacterium]